MDPTHYYSLPEAKLLLDHLHKINPKYGIEKHNATTTVKIRTISPLK